MIRLRPPGRDQPAEWHPRLGSGHEQPHSDPQMSPVPGRFRQGSQGLPRSMVRQSIPQPGRWGFLGNWPRTGRTAPACALSGAGLPLLAFRALCVPERAETRS
jgi:hypothetical protein